MKRRTFITLAGLALVSLIGFTTLTGRAEEADSYNQTIAGDAPVQNVDGSYAFAGKTWDEIKDLGQGNHLVALQGSIGTWSFNTSDWYFTSPDPGLDGYSDSLIKAKIDEWYQVNIANQENLEEYVKPVLVNNPNQGYVDSTITESQGSQDPDGLFTNWGQTMLNIFGTRVDEEHGQKQAFAMSAADVGGEFVTVDKQFGPIDYSWTTRKLTDNAEQHLKNLQGVGINISSWLRSPGNRSYSVAVMYPSISEVVNMLVWAPTAVVPAVVIHLSEE